MSTVETSKNLSIEISSEKIGEESALCVDSRELHQFLEVKTPFKKWIDRKVEDYGFEDGIDFQTNLSKKPSDGISGLFGRPSKEYTITLDMAKELSMVERNEKGREARKYFIKVEKKMQDFYTYAKDKIVLEKDKFEEMIMTQELLKDEIAQMSINQKELFLYLTHSNTDTKVLRKVVDLKLKYLTVEDIAKVIGTTKGAVGMYIHKLLNLGLNLSTKNYGMTLQSWRKTALSV